MCGRVLLRERARCMRAACVEFGGWLEILDDGRMRFKRFTEVKTNIGATEGGGGGERERKRNTLIGERVRDGARGVNIA